LEKNDARSARRKRNGRSRKDRIDTADVSGDPLAILGVYMSAKCEVRACAWYYVVTLMGKAAARARLQLTSGQHSGGGEISEVATGVPANKTSGVTATKKVN
jgi:hypothetical protein